MNSMLDRQSSLVIKPIMGMYLVAPWTAEIPILNRPWMELIEIRDKLWSFLGKQLQVSFFFAFCYPFVQEREDTCGT